MAAPKVIDDGEFFNPAQFKERTPWREGITRRDWLAGLAMQAILSDFDNIKAIFKGLDKASGNMLAKVVADRSYLMADALIKKSREK